MVDQAGTRHEQRALLRQLERLDGGDRSAGVAEEHHHSSRLERVHASFPSRLAHRVVDHIDAGAIGEPFDLSLEVLLRVKDHLVGAGPADQGGLFLSGARPDHTRAAHLSHLHQHQADPARRGVHQRRMTRLQRKGGVGQIVHSHTLHHQRRGCGSVDAIGDLHQTIRRHGGILGVTTQHPAVRHPVSRCETADFGPDRADHARSLLSIGEGKVGLVQARPEIDVDEIDAGDIDLDDGLIGFGNGVGHILVAEYLGPSMFVHAYGFHQSISCRNEVPILTEAPHSDRNRAVTVRRRRGREAAGPRIDILGSVSVDGGHFLSIKQRSRGAALGHLWPPMAPFHGGLQGFLIHESPPATPARIGDQGFRMLRSGVSI